MATVRTKTDVHAEWTINDDVIRLREASATDLGSKNGLWQDRARRERS